MTPLATSSCAVPVIQNAISKSPHPGMFKSAITSVGQGGPDNDALEVDMFVDKKAISDVLGVFPEGGTFFVEAPALGGGWVSGDLKESGPGEQMPGSFYGGIPSGVDGSLIGCEGAAVGLKDGEGKVVAWFQKPGDRVSTEPLSPSASRGPSAMDR